MSKPASHSGEHATAVGDQSGSSAPPLNSVDTSAATMASAASQLDTPTITGDGDPVEPPLLGRDEPEGDLAVDGFTGKVLANRYKVCKRIGVGGFGAVFEAVDTKIGKRVAVKVLARDLVGDSAMLTRFRQEAESASKVGHENIIDITDFDRTSDGYYFLVMEYLDGIDLGSIIRSGNRLSLTRVLGVMIQVARALYAAHNKGIIHRDLKPGNIFLTARGSTTDFVTLLDFGISKFMELDDESSRLTKTGQIIGTPLYMSPEQALGEENLDHRVDVYSVGVIMYELVTGQPPFTAVNYLGIIAQHASDPPKPPTKVRPDLEIPQSVETIILKAMAKQPEDRFSTMSEMEGALIHALATIDPASAVTYAPDATPPSILTTTTGVSQRRLTDTKPMPLWLLLAFAVLVGVGLAIYAARQDSEPPHVPPTRVTPPLVPTHAPLVAPPLPDAGAGEVPATSPDAAARKPPPANTVLIKITSTPTGADVRDERGKLLGRTPLAMRWPRSTRPRKLSLKRKNYRSTRRDVLPDRDRDLVVPLRKRPRGALPDDPKGWGER